MMNEKLIKWWLICLCITGVYSRIIHARRRKVCIVGAGPGGLTAAKQLSMWPEVFTPVVFEKSSDIGGQWLYTDRTDVDEHGLPVHSSIYKYLRTNGPKQIIAFPDYQEFHGESRSYVKHESVLQYLQNFTRQFNLRRYIQFNKLVINISPMTDNLRWNVKIQNLDSDKPSLIRCDAVVVSTGNFNKPNIPHIDGIENFRGRVLHSHAYRRPEEFANKTVVILGASFSGTDIGFEVAKYAKKVYLSHKYRPLTVELPANMIQVRAVVKATENTLILRDSTHVIADALILCTGYLYDFPFLHPNTGVTVDEGKYVHPLYKHFINIRRPTMAILGLLHPGLPFQVLYAQAYYFTSLLRGQITLPSYTDMMKDAELPPGTPKSKAHYMDKDVLNYYSGLAQASGAKPLPPFFKPIISLWFQETTNNLLHFKENDFIVSGNGSVRIIRRQQ